MSCLGTLVTRSMDGLMDGWTDGQMDRWKGGDGCSQCCLFGPKTHRKGGRGRGASTATTPVWPSRLVFFWQKLGNSGALLQPSVDHALSSAWKDLKVSGLFPCCFKVSMLQASARPDPSTVAWGALQVQVRVLLPLCQPPQAPTGPKPLAGRHLGGAFGKSL